MGNSAIFLAEQLQVLAAALQSGQRSCDQAKEVAVSMLGLIEPGKPYGTRLFDALCRLTVTVAPELVILRSGSLGKEVLLRLRNPDEVYAGQWHSPGSAIRPGESIEQVKRRIEQQECGGTILPGPSFCGYDNNQSEKRGHFLHLVFSCDATEVAIPVDGTTTNWFPIHNLPFPTVEHHVRVVIPLACGNRVPSRGLDTIQKY